MILAALTPLLAILGLLVVLRLPAAVAMPTSFALTAGVSVAAWGVPLRRVLAASIEGVLIAASILWIVFGAILLLKVLTGGAAMAAIRQGFALRCVPGGRRRFWHARCGYRAAASRVGVSADGGGHAGACR